MFPVLAGIVVGVAPARAEDGGTWWSLRPVVRPAVPEGEAVNPIDRFLDAEMAVRGLVAVGPADKLTLLRRVALDLTGLPPSPAEQEAFLADMSADAYEKIVDRLLDSEQHAVRYARHWLDVLRYADADENMTAAPGLHLWRDWVINALREDVPYDDFVQLQLTGRRADERTQITNTGYRLARESRPGDLFALGFLARGTGEHPQELALNAVDTVSSAFMGMSVACAKCHDHLFDPISQADYYAMKALFDPLVLRKVTLASAAELVAAGQAMAEVAAKRAPFEKALAELIAPFKERLYEDRVAMLPPDVQAVIRKGEKERSVEEQKIADDYFPILRIDGDKINEVLPEEVRKQSRALEEKRDAAGRESRVPDISVFHTVEVDRVKEKEKHFILTSGDPTRPELEHEVKPGWPFSDGAYDFRDGRIEAFADWLTEPENPLFARVAVNRLWQWHFGEGLHKESSDFGKQAGEPTHPGLLDWLASEFVREGYSMKKMHRLVVTSQAYRRATETGSDDAGNERIDPGNTALWHFRLQRLEAEPVWDAIHAAANRLDLEVGGRSFYPGDEGRGRRGGRGEGKVRRGVYLARGFSPSRDVAPHFLQTFDVDDGRAPCPLRTQTVTAPQSLFLMNGPEIESATAALATRVRAEAGDDPGKAVALSYRLTLARPPFPEEEKRALAYLENDAGRLKQLAWLLFNLDEFLYVR